MHTHIYIYIYMCYVYIVEGEKKDNKLDSNK